MLLRRKKFFMIKFIPNIIERKVFYHMSTARKRIESFLITGGGGFIGAEIVSQLRNDNPDCGITVLDSMTEQIHGKNWHDSYLYKK